MTKLLPSHSLTRETAALERGEPLVVTLHPRYLEIRVKGKRTGVTVDYEAVLALGRKLDYRRNGGRI